MVERGRVPGMKKMLKVEERCEYRLVKWMAFGAQNWLTAYQTIDELDWCNIKNQDVAIVPMFDPS